MLELAQPCRIRIPGGEGAEQVSQRIMLGGATDVLRFIDIDGTRLRAKVAQQVIPPLGGAWERIREARAAS